MFDGLEIDYLWAIAGGVAYFLVGWAWYMVLADQWLAAQGKTKADMQGQSPSPMMALSAVAGVVTAFVVALVYEWAGGDGVADGIVVSLVVSLGVVAMETLKGVVYSEQSWNLYLINAGYAVVGLGIAGAIYGAFA